MSGLLAAVAPEVFALVPGYERAVIECVIDDPASCAGWVGRALADASVRRRALAGAVPVVDLPAVASWREAFRSCGINPSKFRPSYEALLRRVLQGADLGMGNPLVDLGTTASLDAGCPVGMHTVDDLDPSDGDTVLELRHARGDESFTAFDSAVSAPDPGEVIYAHGDRVMTRRWAWRQGSYGSLRADGPHVVAVNVDLLPSADLDTAAAVDTVAAALKRAGARELSFVRLTAHRPARTLPDARDRC